MDVRYTVGRNEYRRMTTEELRAALAALAAQYQEEGLRRDAQALSERYRLRTGTGRRLLTGEREAAAYAAARMPASAASMASRARAGATQ